MDASAALGGRHALNAVDAALELQLGEHACAADRGNCFLEAADVGFAGGDQLEPPALRLGEALVHAQQVAGEQRGLVAASPGANLEHCGALVGGVARQQLQRERALGFGQLVADVLRFRRGHFLELGLGGWIGEHAVQHLELGAQPPHFARRRRDRLDLRHIPSTGERNRRARGRAPPSRLRAPASSPRSTAIRSDEMRVMLAIASADAVERHRTLLAAGKILQLRLAAVELVVADDEGVTRARSHSPGPAASSYSLDKPCPWQRPARAKPGDNPNALPPRPDRPAE